jgi:large subunit ribosomal protein L23
MCFSAQVHFIQLFGEGMLLLTCLFFNYSWNKKEFHESEKFQSEMQKEFSGQNATKAPESAREAYEKQAKDILEGKTAWRPTWQALGLQYDRAALKKFAVQQGAEAGTKPVATAADATVATPTESPSKDSTSPSTNS